MLLIPFLFAGITAFEDYFLDDGFHPILSDFSKGKLYMVKVVNNFADQIGSVCVGDHSYSLKGEHGERFADAVCNRLGFAGSKFHGKKDELPAMSTSLNPSRTCDFDFVVNGAKCNGTSLDQCHLRETAHSGKRACITGKSEFFLECNWDGNSENDKLTKIETNECDDGDEFETILRMCGVPTDEEKRNGLPTSSRVKRCYGPIIERKCCKSETAANYNPDYNANYYNSEDTAFYSNIDFGGSDPFARGTTPEVCECTVVAQWNRVNKDEVKTFSNIYPDEAIEGSSERSFFSSDDSIFDLDFYDDESGENSLFLYYRPADYSLSESDSVKNTTRDTETPSSAMKMTFGLCLFFSYFL